MTDLESLHRLIPWGRHQVPALWAHMLPEEIGWMKVPDESFATCDNCYKVELGAYRADCRCCTYFPQVPNFALGLARELDLAGPTIDRLIDAGYVLPLGLIASPWKLRQATQAYARDDFGKLPEMACPFLLPDTYDCRIYPLRNSVCSTFFCTFDHGPQGGDFWGRVQRLVGHVETALAHWALEQVGFAAAALQERLDSLAPDIGSVSADDDGAWSAAALDCLWGDWRGREKELLAACAAAVRAQAHDTALYDIACGQTIYEALAFDRAVQEWLPAELRAELPPVADEPGQLPAIETLWYELQLAARRLWELPFSEGTVALASGVRILDNSPQLLGARGKPFRVVCDDLPLFLSTPQADLLRSLQSPQRLDEAFFAKAEVLAVDDVRGFLAQCLRRGVLARASGRS